MPTAISPPDTIVLDTNVVLDWLVFNDPACRPLAEHLVSGRVNWVATSAMREELADVLGRGAAAAWKPDLAHLWMAWSRHATEVPADGPTGSAARLFCTDRDDQKFIDLALGRGARWLFSRDRAVLKLARRARAFNLSIVTPQAWALDR